jgi:methyl-accepting chemotaxis protein
MQNANLETLFIIFIGITGVAVSLQAGVLLALFLTVRKAIATARARSEGLEGKLIPVLDNVHELLGTGKELVGSVRDLVARLDPHLQSAAAELDVMSKDIHAQATRLQASVDDVAKLARRQAERVDGMTTSFLNGLDRFGSFVNQAVDAPIRQLSGVVAAAKAVIETLRSPAPPRTRREAHAAPKGKQQPAHETDDKDLFV